MKLILLSKVFLVVSFAFGPIVAQQWIWQNPLPQGASMFTVITLSEERAIITGKGGTVMATDDGGLNWEIQKLPELGTVRKYSFVSEEDGWIIGDWTDITANYDTTKTRRFGKIFRTNDGGFNWQELSITIEIDYIIYSFNDIEFIDNKTGFILAVPLYAGIGEEGKYPGLIYKTKDGGYNWTLIDIGISRKFYQIVFTDSLTGYLLSQLYYSNFDFDNNLLHKTIDGSNTWTTYADSGFGIINFIDDQVGWAGNYRTTDGGGNWEYHDFDRFDNVNFVDSLVGYALDYNTILKTSDGGVTWVEQIETKNGILQDIKFYNPSIGYACGNGGTIFSTIDGGDNWIRYGEGVTENLQDVDFINENYGWTVGFNGTVLHTENGGEIWEKQIIPAECDSIIINGVDFIDEKEGWITGGEYILNTKNSGNNWNIQLKTDLENGFFRDIKFLDSKKGFAVGQKGTLYGYGIIYRTFDGGKTWQRIDDSDLSKLYEIYFIDNDNGWICGSGILLSTRDGGYKWEKEYFYEKLQYMQFTDSEHGWISAVDEGAFYRTTDDGKNWEFIPFSNRYTQFLSSFYFMNYWQGIATGFLFCNILTTEDGGINWTYREQLPLVRINAMTFVNDNNGWAVGYDGAIMKLEGTYFTVSSVENENSRNNQEKILIGNYPNPFNSTTRITYSIPEVSNVKISIYDITGRLIKSYKANGQTAGYHNVEWDGTNQNGVKVSSGIYIYRMFANSLEDNKNFVQSKKMILLR